jgi:AraC family transcriptional regulator
VDTTSQQELPRSLPSFEGLFSESEALDLSCPADHLGVQIARAPEKGHQTRTKGGLVAWQSQRIARYIHESLHTKLLIRVLASQVYLSEFHFCRAFRLSFGESPHVYVTRCRMETAKRLLSTTKMPIGDIALECGAADQAHFTNLFRRCTGQTPGAWRRLGGTDGHYNVAPSVDGVSNMAR